MENMMKLIDLLVRELPKRGGWPGDNAPGFYLFLESNNITFEFDFDCAYFKNQHGDTVNRAQYETARASQNVEWDGVGLPPVGCECEMNLKCHGDTYWKKINVLWADNDEIFYEIIGKGVKQYHSNVSNTHSFRPICSEADNIRKETIDLMDKRFKEVLAAGSTEAMAIFATVYDTIAAGKIPCGPVE